MEEKLELLKQKLEANEDLLKQLVEQETPEKVKALLKENDVELSLQEAGEVKKAIAKAFELAEEGKGLERELSEDELDEVGGGSLFLFIISVIIASALTLGVLGGTGAIEQVVNENKSK
ncbi:hypothetical protein [Anoxynatronum sibiricum]|uniref:Uncharacterized protein n=1 Tax=Anoxynatronum sibiricum TaxID=210623 RepID=A0ABU9VWA3_9CLOT